MPGRIHFSALLPPTVTPGVITTSHLRRTGMTKATIAAAASNGVLIRVRRGRYLPFDTHPHVVSAAAHGGRLDCVSLLAVMGVFVLVADGLHVQIPTGASRLPVPRRGVVRHWRPARGDAFRTLADGIEAVAQAVRCQSPRASVATLDSVLHLRLLDEAGLDEVFALLPRRFGALRPLVDGRSESGAESLVRLILRSIGCDVELQVVIDGVGRVDFLVDGWLSVECDSRADHGDWASARRD